MDIRTALDRIIVVQAGLAITTPIAASIKKAYKFMPPQSAAAPDTPCFMNAWSLVEERRNSNGFRTQLYTVHMQLFVEDADQDRAADIASSFMKEFVAAFDDDQTLNGACTTQTLRGGSPTLAILERAGRSYIGLDLFMDVTMSDTTVSGP